MKKVISLFIFLLVVGIIPVNAANYSIKELIPKGVETTVRTDNFTYGDIIYDNSVITINRAINLQDEDKPLSMTIALLDRDETIIGLVKYCSSKDNNLSDDNKLLKPHTETKYEIKINDDYLQDKKISLEIKYISILDENLNCPNEITDDYYYGLKIKDIGVYGKSAMDSKANFAFQVLGIVGVIGLIIIIYQFAFTNAHENVDGNDLRKAYKDYNKELERERKIELMKNPPQPKEVKKTKTDEVIKQEEEANKENEEGTDLHNLYK